MDESGSQRRFLCMYCRCLLDDDQRHKALGHEVVPFDAHGRSALILATRPSTMSRRSKSYDELSGTVVTGAVIALVVLSLFATGVSALSGALAVAFIGLWIGLALYARSRERPALAHYRAQLSAPSNAREFTGVLSGDEKPDPLAGVPCLAFSIELHNLGASTGTLLCRDERCFGATLQADDGVLVRLQRTSAEVYGEPVRIDPQHVGWQDYMRRAGIVTDGGHILFHVDEIQISYVLAGDRARVRAVVELEAKPKAAGAHYRESAESQLVAMGTPSIERLFHEELLK